MDSDEITEFIHDVGAEHNVQHLQIQQHSDAMRQADVVKIYKRLNGEKIGGEISLTYEMQDQQLDLLNREIEQIIRQMKDVITEEMGPIHEYRGREISCCVDAELARAQCCNCNYILELGELPYIVQENGTTAQTITTIERWRKEKLAMYMCEKIDRECPCGMHRRQNRNL